VTLLELMIALVVLAFGLLTVAAAQIHAMRGSSSGRHTTQAASIAQSQLAQLQRQRWTTIPATGWTAPVTVTNTVQAPANMNEETYAVSWRIADLPGERRAIDVRVTWNEPNRPARSYTLSSVRYNYEGL